MNTYCAWSKYSEVAQNPEGCPAACVAMFRDLGPSESAPSVPDGFARVTTVQDYQAYVDATRGTLDDFQRFQEWKQRGAQTLSRAEAQKRIFGLIGVSETEPLAGVIKQLNLMANCNRIIARKVLDGIEPTENERALVGTGVYLVDKVNAIRAYSNELEQRAAQGEMFDVAAQAWPT